LYSKETNKRAEIVWGGHFYDCCFVWAVQVVAAFILSRFTNLHIFAIFGICNGLDILKCILGGWLIKKGSWIQNLAGKRA